MLIAISMNTQVGVAEVTKEELDTLYSVFSRLEPALQNYDALNGPRYTAQPHYRVPIHIEFVLPHDWKSLQQIRDEQEAAQRQVNM